MKNSNLTIRRQWFSSSLLYKLKCLWSLERGNHCLLMIYPAELMSLSQGTEFASMRNTVFASEASLGTWILSNFNDKRFNRYIFWRLIAWLIHLSNSFNNIFTRYGNCLLIILSINFSHINTCICSQHSVS